MAAYRELSLGKTAHPCASIQSRLGLLLRAHFLQSRAVSTNTGPFDRFAALSGRRYACLVVG